MPADNGNGRFGKGKSDEHHDHHQAVCVTEMKPSVLVMGETALNEV